MLEDRRTSVNPADFTKHHFLPILLLLLLTVAAYHGLTSHSFLVNWDDMEYVTENPAITGISWSHVKMAFSRFYVGNYAPIQIISYMFDYALWGLNPTGFLLANVAYHFTSGVLLYFLLIRMGMWQWGACIGCAVFLVHPVQMESVAWVSQRKNVLSMLFFLLAFHAYFYYRDNCGNNAFKWYTLSVVFCFMALLSKSVAVIFPFMLVLHEYLFLSKSERFRQQRDKIPYLIGAVAIGMLTISIQTPGVVGGRVPYPDNALIVLPLTMFKVLLRYFRNLVCPIPSNLNIIYSTPLASSVDLPVFLSMCVVVGLIILGVRLHRRARSFFFWYCLFFIGLLPVSQIVPMVTKMNDRYLYFPMLGVAGMIGYASGGLQGWISSKAVKKTVFFTTMIMVAVLAFASHVRGKVWQSSLTLFGDAVSKIPNQFVLLVGLAEAYRVSGDIEKAIQYYDKASFYGFLNEVESYHLAQAYLEQGNYEKAFNHIWGYLLKSNNSAEGLLMLSEYYLVTGAYGEAEKKLLTYLAKAPDSPKGLFMLGKAYYMMGNFSNARSYYFRSIEAGGNDPELFVSIAVIESLNGNIGQSLTYLEEALKRGYSDFASLQTNEDMAVVRNDPGYRRIAERYLNK